MKIKNKNTLHSAVFGWGNKVHRVMWILVYAVFFRWSPIPFFSYRRWILKCFGASLHDGVNVYPSVKIWFPSNLTMDVGSTLGPKVNVYNQGGISIGCNTVISQGAYLCASTHDYNDPVHPLVLAPISIGDNVWVCSEAFVGPGVSIADGAVVGARAVLNKSADNWSVYAGNPAIKVKERKKFD